MLHVLTYWSSKLRRNENPNVRRANYYAGRLDPHSHNCSCINVITCVPANLGLFFPSASFPPSNPSQVPRLLYLSVFHRWSGIQALPTALQDNPTSSNFSLCLLALSFSVSLSFLLLPLPASTYVQYKSPDSLCLFNWHSKANTTLNIRVWRSNEISE